MEEMKRCGEKSRTACREEKRSVSEENRTAFEEKNRIISEENRVTSEEENRTVSEEENNIACSEKNRNPCAEENCIACKEEKRSCCRTKKRAEKEYRDLQNRLNRIEGQIRGIKSMVEKDAYCTDILVQVSAATAALNSFSRVLLGNHIRTCVTEDIRNGKDETVEELITVLQKLMK